MYKGMDVNLGVLDIPDKRKDVYLQMVEMIEETEKDVYVRYGFPDNYGT